MNMNSLKRRVEKLEKSLKNSDAESLNVNSVDKEKRDNLVRHIAPIVFSRFQLPDKATASGDSGTFVFSWGPRNKKSVNLVVGDAGYDVVIWRGIWFVSHLTVADRAIEILGKALDIMNEVQGYKSLLEQFPRMD